MTTRIRIKLGSTEIDLEGSEDFLESKFDKLIKDICNLPIQVPAEIDSTDLSVNTKSEISTTLVSFLKEKKADSQNKRFLATAEWLHLKGSKRIKTADITQALRDSNQKRLGNPSDILNKNIAKGFCEKDGKEFFVTPDGRSSLG